MKSKLKEKKLDEHNLRVVHAGIKIAKKQCNGCGKCVDVCPCGAITKDGDQIVVSKHCIMCGKCKDVCPREAIKVTK